MITPPSSVPPPVTPRPPVAASLLAATVAPAAFHLAWTTPRAGPLMAVFVLGLLQLTALPGPRAAFYAGLGVGLAVYSPHLGFFWTVFGPAAVVLWSILAAWLGAFVVLSRAVRRRWGLTAAAWLVPALWMGLEYGRSELYYLRFSWLSLGYAFADSPAIFARTGLGVYGVGGVLAAVAALAWSLSPGWRPFALAAGLAGIAAAALPARPETPRSVPERRVRLTGLQLEYPFEDDLLKALEEVPRRAPGTQLTVLSEYTLQRPPPDALRDWCRRHDMHLIVGGKDPGSDNSYFNTAFVVGPAGNIVFQQAKSVPIQFFDDGRPARRQQLWESPWGRIGLGICYDLSYRRVMDRLIALGAEALIIPTADDSSWGERQHHLHARIARVRAAEYGVPIVRVAGSGISQWVDPRGALRGAAPFPGPGELLQAAPELGRRGRLPLDHWLAPLSAAITTLTLGALILRRRPASSTPAAHPRP